MALLLTLMPVPLGAHSGPPFPLLSDRVEGPYLVSLWTDPDATDDGAAAGRFWVMVGSADRAELPPDTHALITIRPADRSGPSRSARTAAVNGDISRQFAALLMDHEGPYIVEVTIAGSRGTAAIGTNVDATYDLRPARWLLALYVMPFIAVGFLWLKLLITRRGGRARRTEEAAGAEATGQD
jgi:hypothetical protein